MDNNFTVKTMDAIKAAQSAAVEHNHMEIAPAHLLYALLMQDDSLIVSLLDRMQVDSDALRRGAEEALTRISSVTGPGREAGKIYISQETDRLMTAAAIHSMDLTEAETARSIS